MKSKDTTIKKVKGYSSAYPNICSLKLLPNIDGTWITVQDDVGTSMTIKLSDLDDFIRTETVTEFSDRCRECGKMRTAHWIFVDKAHQHAHCSKCDYGNVDLMDGRPHNYCPNCGRKMAYIRGSNCVRSNWNYVQGTDMFEPQESEG